MSGGTLGRWLPIVKLCAPLALKGSMPYLCLQILFKILTKQNNMVRAVTSFGIAYNLTMFLLSTTYANYITTNYLVKTKKDMWKISSYCSIIPFILVALCIFLSVTSPGRSTLLFLFSIEPGVIDAVQETFLPLSGLLLVDSINESIGGIIVGQKDSFIPSLASFLEGLMPVLVALVMMETSFSLMYPMLVPIISIYSGRVVSTVLLHFKFWKYSYSALTSSSDVVTTGEIMEVFLPLCLCGLGWRIVFPLSKSLMTRTSPLSIQAKTEALAVASVVFAFAKLMYTWIDFGSTAVICLLKRNKENGEDDSENTSWLQVDENAHEDELENFTCNDASQSAATPKEEMGDYSQTNFEGLPHALSNASENNGENSHSGNVECPKLIVSYTDDEDEIKDGKGQSHFTAKNIDNMMGNNGYDDDSEDSYCVVQDSDNVDRVDDAKPSKSTDDESSKKVYKYTYADLITLQGVVLCVAVLVGAPITFIPQVQKDYFGKLIGLSTELTNEVDGPMKIFFFYPFLLSIETIARGTVIVEGQSAKLSLTILIKLIGAIATVLLAPKLGIIGAEQIVTTVIVGNVFETTTLVSIVFFCIYLKRTPARPLFWVKYNAKLARMKLQSIFVQPDYKQME